MGSRNCLFLFFYSYVLFLFIFYDVTITIADDIIQDLDDESDHIQWEVFLLIFWILLFFVSVRFLVYSQNVKLVSAVCIYLCSTLTIFTFWKEYKLSTPIEYIFVAFCYFYRLPITFPMFSCLKMIVSLVFCIYEIVCCHSDNTIELKYLIRYPWRSCHAYISVGNNVYHSSFPAGQAATTMDRSYNLSPSDLNEKSAARILAKSVFAPCVGLGILTSKETILEKLYLCGKCHDWAVVALYLLSTQKYLTYSALFAYRWTSWIILVITVVTYFLFSDSYFDSKPLPTNIDALIAIPDVLLLLVTLFDVTNFKKERLSDNREFVGTKYPHRGRIFDTLKLSVLGCLLLGFCTWVNDHQLVPKFGYFIYFLSSVGVSASTHYLFTGLRMKGKRE